MLLIASLTDYRLVTLLKDGAVGVIPTDTIYGLAAAADNPHAVAKLYALKHREHKPGTIIAASPEQLMELGVDSASVRAVAKWWPNSLSIVLPAAPSLAYLDQQVGSLAVRVPKDDVLQALLRQTGPLVTSSANHPGLPPATTIPAAQAYFGDAVDFYVHGGDLGNRPPSTVARLVQGGLVVLRQGAVTID